VSVNSTPKAKTSDVNISPLSPVNKALIELKKAVGLKNKESIK